MRGSRLFGVATASARSAWAVGCSACPHQERTLTAHWNGVRWKRVPSPSPPGGAALYAVAAGPRGTAWAVGAYRRAGHLEPLMLHWAGHTWTRLAVPVASRGILDAVAVAVAVSGRAAGCTGCFGADQNALILRWNGATWARTPSPIRGNLFAVATAPGGTAWAAGIAGTGELFHPRPLILRWTGQAWARVPCPAPAAGTSVYSLEAISDRNAWAVGQTASFGNPHPRPVALRWNGTSWR